MLLNKFMVNKFLIFDFIIQYVTVLNKNCLLDKLFVLMYVPTVLNKKILVNSSFILDPGFTWRGP